ncbi:lysyl-tRNA synthetase class 1 [Kineosphaera limosa]|uniref:Lysine--tRNA ligase n=1 Tax=Kineosphaera limosa NBRC 100340 TaxID=1184609 RepID=K6WTY7_9MICO|nr:lysine--tRNA ligase [Kineosphaera limosa]NYD99886.1 lysyl-tRNA synthetase class 1 [Kineosphaera limosa]GAB95577.1 lysine--tRNA ligase [Kineosphaera limosa NBRC 100340]
MSQAAQQAQQDWVTRLADEVIEEATRRQGGTLTRPIVCASGLSPSGPIHLGNLREVMVPHFVADEIARRGIAVEHIISWDDYDRFRKVPASVEGVDDSWKAHIGKPLTSVPAPHGSGYDNWAAHFKAPMKAALQMMGVAYRGISQSEQYTSGAYREQVLHAMRDRERIDKVLDRYRTKAAAPAKTAGGQAPLDEDAQEAADLAAVGSGAAGEDDGSGTGGYFPFRPYSKAFGTDDTRVIAYDEASTELTYVANGPQGEQVTETMHLDRDTHGKLVWKVDWPMRWAYEGVDFEPSGVDHQSPGSSFVVGGQLVEEIFGGHQPIGPMYAFVGIAGMAKMSSSRGGVPTPADALVIMEAPLLRWLYVRRRPNQSFTVSFDTELLRLYDEWDALTRKVVGGSAQPGDLAAYERSVRTTERELTLTPRSVPYRALASIIDITGGHPEQTLRILEGFDVAGSITSLDDVRPRLDCASSWVHTQLDPGDRTRLRTEPNRGLLAELGPQQRDALGLLAQRLTDDWSLDGLTTLTYGIPKAQAGLDVGEKKLPPEVKKAQRELFRLLYLLLIDKETGPRLPTLLLCVGPDRVRHLIGH